jgi:hypothetical protein
MEMEKRRLANGEVTVWEEEDGGIVIHHAAGLTIALTLEETQALHTWLEEPTDLTPEQVKEITRRRTTR